MPRADDAERNAGRGSGLALRPARRSTSPAPGPSLPRIATHRGSRGPLIYRFYELVTVYGTTLKELIAEAFGDGIMSAIDFRMDLAREPDPAGDRVKITMSGKFLPYRSY